MSDEYEFSVYYGNIKYCNASDGPGVRVSIYFSGCRVHCLGCHNPETWDFKYGKRFTQKELNEVIASIKQPFYKGLSILGGEPLDPDNRDDVFEVIKQCYNETKKSIWLWTSYTFEEIVKREIIPLDILKCIDVIVDGRFMLDKKDLSLYYRGSSNQRVIDVQASLDAGETVVINVDKTGE